MAEHLIRGGLVIDQSGERRADVVVADGRIAAVGPDLDVPQGALVVDAGGCVVAPGLVDLHTHLRQPGNEEAETLESGALAAARGGYTAVLAMPNTEPAVDNASVVRDILELSAGLCCQVAVAGAITVGRQGERLAPLGEMASLGVHLFTDDGRGVQDAGLMRRALEYGGPLGVVLAQHCEDESLARGGHMHEGSWSSRLGVPAQPALAEESMVARDIALVRLTGSPLHFLHLSTRGSVALLRRAKEEGLPVTAEATPHHLSLTDACLAGYDTAFKVNPPLREEADLEALRSGCADRTIDAIATDHAPHAKQRKEEPLDKAPPGMTGLETAFAAAHTALCVEAGLPLAELLAMMCWRPARIAGLGGNGSGCSRQGGPIEPGRRANICVIDPAEQWTFDIERSLSLSRNSPFAGSRFTGRIRHTFFEGELVCADGEVQR